MSVYDQTRLRRVLTTMPDRVFFDLWRTYFGELPSPHNRQDLVDRFARYLGEDDIRQAMLEVRTPEDQVLLDMVGWLGAIREDDLFAMAAGDLDKINFHHKILNLEDRLWLFRDPKGGELFLNPFLASECAAHGAAPPLDAGFKDEHPASDSWLGDSFFAAIIASWPDLSDLLRADGSLSKRSESWLSERFSGLADFGAELQTEIFVQVLQAMTRLGLAGMPAGTKKTLRLCLPRVQAFASLPASDRRLLFAAAAVYPNPAELGRGGPATGDQAKENAQRLGFQSIGVLTRFARLLQRFLQLLDPTMSWDRLALVRRWTIASYLEGGKNPPCNEQFLTALVSIGLLYTTDKRYRVTSWTSQNVSDAIHLGQALDVLVGPGPDLHTLLPVLTGLQLERFGRETHYRFYGSRMKELFASGTTRESIQAALGVAAFPETLVFHLNEWEQAAAGSNCAAGFLVDISPQRGVEAETLLGSRPGVRRLDESTWFVQREDNDALDALVSAGLLENHTVDAAREGRESIEPPDYLPALQALPQAPEPLYGSATLSSGSPVVSERGNERRVRLLAEVDANDWPDVDKQQARALIRSGVIVDSRQLAWKPLPAEKGRAGGLDHRGKINLIEEAIKSRNEYLEILMVGSDGDLRLMAWPEHLKGTAADTALEAHTMPERNPTVIPVRKMAEVRRIRNSFASGV